MANRKITVPPQAVAPADAEARIAPSQTLRRILAYLASVRPLVGTDGPDDADWRGRSIIERMAFSSEGDDPPEIELSADECADVLWFMHSVEPFEPQTWWQDPESGPSPVAGFHIVLRTLAECLGGSQR